MKVLTFLCNLRRLIEISQMEIELKGPIDNFKPSPWGIMITDDTNIPRGTNVIVPLPHKPLVILNRDKQIFSLDLTTFLK